MNFVQRVQGSGQGLGIGFMAISLTSMQVGNSFAKRLTEQMASPIGAVWMRLAFSGVVLGLFFLIRWLVERAVGRCVPTAPATPPTPTDGVSPITTTRRTRASWAYAIAYGVAIVTMNSLFYEAIARIPVGIVITIEFLGPLAVAILGSRRPADFGWVALAAAGIVILGITPTKLTSVGVALSLGAGVCWAAYILLGSRVARHWQGVEVLTGTCIVGTFALLPLFLLGGNAATLAPHTLVLGLIVALTCTVLPYSVELLALKRLPTGLFAIIESLSPAGGALAAWWLLGQVLHYGDWIAIACIVIASVGASVTTMRSRPGG